MGEIIPQCKGPAGSVRGRVFQVDFYPFAQIQTVDRRAKVLIDQLLLQPRFFRLLQGSFNRWFEACIGFGEVKAEVPWINEQQARLDRQVGVVLGFGQDFIGTSREIVDPPAIFWVSA